MFDWDEANEGHIRERHAVSAAEAEEALLDPDRSAYSSRIDGVEKRWRHSRGTGPVHRSYLAWHKDSRRQRP